MSVRKRASNFNQREELILLEEVIKFKEIVENKATDSVTCTQKNKAWTEITLNYNSKNFESRNIDQLKGKYDNLKSKARKWATNNKKDFNRIGGPPPDPTVELILKNIKLPKTVVGSASTCDDDSDISVNSVPPLISSDTKPSIIFVDVHDIENVATAGSSKELAVNEQSFENENTLSDQEQSLSNKVKEAVNRNNNVQTSQSDWNSYTVSKIDKKLPPKVAKVTNPVLLSKEIYYKKKTELIEAEKAEIKLRIEKTAELREEERDFKKRKHEREEEEHTKKMLLLDLQIEKLKQSLN